MKRGRPPACIHCGSSDSISKGLSTRRLLGLCARLERGNDFKRALQVCVLNKIPPEDVKVVQETFDHHLGPIGQQQGAA